MPATDPTPDETPEFDKLQMIKLGIDLGPLILFALAYWQYGLYYATGTLMVASLVALAVSKIFLKKIDVMPAVTAGIVVLFGGMTLWLQDPAFIKMKPTVVYAIFAAILLGGLVAKRNFLAVLFGQVFTLSDEGWRILTRRWAIFFVFLAILNELVWRNYSEQTWIYFKLFGFTGLTLVFAAFQYGLIKRYTLTSDAEA